MTFICGSFEIHCGNGCLASTMIITAAVVLSFRALERYSFDCFVQRSALGASPFCLMWDTCTVTVKLFSAVRSAYMFELHRDLHC